jgi:hypothetical protein
MNFLFLPFGGGYPRRLGLAPSQILMIFNNLEDFSASGGRVVFAASAFRLAKTSWAFVLLQHLLVQQQSC